MIFENQRQRCAITIALCPELHNFEVGQANINAELVSQASKYKVKVNVQLLMSSQIYNFMNKLTHC
jgi:hypothetical protein